LEEGRTSLTPAGTRIAYLVSQYPAVNHTFILREIRQLRQLGFDVRVASVRPADRPFESLALEEQEEQLATYYIKPVGPEGVIKAALGLLSRRPIAFFGALGYAFWLARLNPRTTLSYLFYFAEAVVFAGWMRREGLSRVHMHFTSTVGLLARRLTPMRTSVTIHGAAEFDDAAGFRLREKIEAFDLLCTISEYGRNQLMKLSDRRQWNKLRVSRLGVDPAIYSPRPFRYNPAPFEILCVGRLAKVKGQAILIGAIDRLVRKGHAVLLRLVGDGPERAILERQVVERSLGACVIFEGWQGTERVRDSYQQADVVALASLAEGIPVALMEAMAMEIPCVATAVMGVPELIRHELDGLLVGRGSEDELAAAIARYLDDSELRQRLGKAGRRRVLEHFDLYRNTAALADTLREVPPAAQC
jgi:glycosyltransferase involved in cell wall biosynthesis